MTNDGQEQPRKVPRRKPRKPSQSFIAKKSFVICQNEYFRRIEVGENISDIPERYIPNLITEGVL
jgi:hypothetical protein